MSLTRADIANSISNHCGYSKKQSFELLLRLGNTPRISVDAWLFCMETQAKRSWTAILQYPKIDFRKHTQFGFEKLENVQKIK